MKNMKYILGLAVLTISFSANAQTPTSKLEYTDGPTSKIDQASIKEIEAYAKNAATSISRLKSIANQISDSEKLKAELSSGINQMINTYKNTRSARLLVYSLQSCMKLVNFIDEVTIQRGSQFTPQGTVDQQVRLMKRSLDFAEKYYQSELTFVNGVLTQVEAKTNPKFVEFGMELNSFLIKMSDGVLSARANYGMIRWSLAVLANNIKNDKELGIAYASTRANIAQNLLKQLSDGQMVYPDLVEHESNPYNDAELIIKVRELKLLAQDSLAEMKKVVIKKVETASIPEYVAPKKEVVTQTTPVETKKNTESKPVQKAETRRIENKPVVKPVVDNSDRTVTAKDGHILTYTRKVNTDGTATFTGIDYSYGDTQYSLANGQEHNFCLAVKYARAISNQVGISSSKHEVALLNSDGTFKNTEINFGLSKVTCSK